MNHLSHHQRRHIFSGQDQSMMQFINGEGTIYKAEREIVEYIKQIHNFVLWHYQFGSKYDTPFWDYAKTLVFEDNIFDQFLAHAKTCDQYSIVPDCYGGGTLNHQYGQWSAYASRTGMME